MRLQTLTYTCGRGLNPCSVDKGNFISETKKVTTSLLYTITDDFQ